MNITQEYNIGVPFNTYTTAELSSSDWKWPMRTLSGFRDEDGNFVELGAQITRNTERSYLSGVWTLNKSTHPLKIYGIGQSGSLSVRIYESNATLPLADSSHPYERTQEFTLYAGLSVSTDLYYSKETGYDNLSIELIPDDGTIIKRISCGSAATVGADGVNVISCSLWDSDTSYYYINGNRITFNNFLWSGISVDFIQGGVLMYIPNTNTLNQNHPQN